MANTITTIQIKYSNSNAAPISLNTAEPAYSNVSNKLWIGDGTDVVAIGGKYYTDIIDAATYANTANTLVKRGEDGDISVSDITANTITITDSISTNNVETQNAIVRKKLWAGIATESATILPDVIAQFTSNSESYVQVNQQNIDGNGSADFVVTADVGTDTDFFIDFGFNNSTFDNTDYPIMEPLSGYVITQGSTIGQEGGNMFMGTTTPGTHIKVIAGGYYTDNVVATITNDGFVFDKDVTVSGDLVGNTINTLSSYSNTSYLHANAAYDSQNTTGSYANSAYLQANAAYLSQNSTGSYANSAYVHANAAYVSQNSTGNFANSAYGHANGAYSHANSAYDLANTDVTYLSTAAGIFGSASIVPVFNIAANGRVYDVTNTTIAIDTSQVTTGILPVVRGGTGNNAFTTNHVLIGNGTDAVTTTGSSTEGHVLTISSSGVPTFQHLSGGTF